MGIASGKRRALRKGRLSIALLVVLSGSATAIDLDYEIGVAAEHSDNMNLSDDNPISDTVISPQLDFHAEQIGRDVELVAQGNVQYRYYTGDTFDDEVRGKFAGTMNWRVVPERLDLVVQDYLSLQPVDDLVEFTPTNQQQVNVFVAGPTLHARFGSAMRGQMDLRYINSYAEEEDSFDSDRYNIAARLLRQVSPDHEVSANLEATDVSFDNNEEAADYRRYDGYINSTMRRQRMDLLLDLGYSRVDFDDNITLAGSDTEESYPLARATLNWRPSQRSLFGATVRYQLSDATRSLMAPLDLDLENFAEFRSPDGLAEPNVFRERLLRLRYGYTGERTTLQVAPYLRRIRYYEDIAPSQDRRGVAASLEHRLRPRLTLSAYGVMESREFTGIAREDDDFVIGVGLENRFTRHWTGRMDVLRQERDSTDVGRSYTENAVMISFSYRR